MPTRVFHRRMNLKNRTRARGGRRAADPRRTCRRKLSNCIELAACGTKSCNRLESFSNDPIGFAAGDANLYRYVGNGPTTKTDPSGLKTKSHWQGVVLGTLGISGERLDGYVDFSPANQKIMKAIYGYYDSAFDRNPNLLWAGMAKMAGRTVWRGLNDGQCYGSIIPGQAQNLAFEIERQLVSMNRQIFMDLAWQHEAYLSGGIEEINESRQRGELSIRNWNAWQLIDKGITDGNRDLVSQGNKLLLKREQQIILAEGYRALAALNMGKIMGAMATSPIPFGDSFSTVVPGGSLCDFDDRWRWISQELFPRWASMSAETRSRLSGLSLDTSPAVLEAMMAPGLNDLNWNR